MEELDRFDNPEKARALRGAEWTFDADLFYSLVRLMKKITDRELYAPSFDHAIGDPVVDDICVEPKNRILIFEGNYLLLNKPPWSDACKLYDIKAYLPVEHSVARARVAHRHLVSGLCATEEEAIERTDRNDMINLTFVEKNMVTPDIVLQQLRLKTVKTSSL